MAATAHVIGCTELNEQAVVATNNFPGIYRGKSCGHLGFGSSQSVGTPRSRWSGSKSQGNLGQVACGCQGISGAKQEIDSIKNQKDTAKNRRKQGRSDERSSVGVVFTN